MAMAKWTRSNFGVLSATTRTHSVTTLRARKSTTCSTSSTRTAAARSTFESCTARCGPGTSRLVQGRRRPSGRVSRVWRPRGSRPRGRKLCACPSLSRRSRDSGGSQTTMTMRTRTRTTIRSSAESRRPRRFFALWAPAPRPEPPPMASRVLDPPHRDRRRVRTGRNRRRTGRRSRRRDRRQRRRHSRSGSRSHSRCRRARSATRRATRPSSEGLWRRPRCAGSSGPRARTDGSCRTRSASTIC